MSAVAIQRETTVAEAGTTAALIQMIERAASNPAVDMDKMERLLQMQERILAKQAEALFNEAMTLAQADMPRIHADKTNNQTRSVYASYAEIDRTIREVYTRHGFALSFDTGDGAPAEYVRVLCYVSHRAGHTRTYKADMPADGKGAKGGDVMTKTHAMGSGIQYGKRYLLQAIFNLAIGDDPNDDDGNGADASPLRLATIAKLKESTDLADMRARYKALSEEERKSVTQADKDAIKAALQ